MIKSFFSLIFIVLLFVSSLGYVLFRLQDPPFVVASARSVNLYGRLTTNIEPLITNNIGLEGSDVVDVVKASVDGEQFYSFTNAALSAYLPWLTGRTNSLTFSYDLTTTKQKMTSELTARILTKYESLPECTAPQLRSWSFKDQLPACQLAPKTVLARTLQSQAAALATKVVDPLPDQLNTGEPSGKLIQIRDGVAKVFHVIYLVWGLTALLLLIFLLIWRASGLVTLAISFLFVGALQVAFSIVGWDWIAKTIGDLIGGSSEAKALLPLGIDLISVIIQSLKTVLGNISIGFFIAGAISLILGLIAGARTPKFVEKIAKPS